MMPGCWATSACTVPSFSALIWLGPASKPTILTWSPLPAWRTPVAVPSAANRLAAKTPTMSGSFCSAELIRLAAVAGSLCEYCTPRYWNLGSALTASSKPLARASVVEMPGSTDMTMTLPPSGLSCLIASNAALPPPTLSEAIAEVAIRRVLGVVSTRTTLIARLGRRLQRRLHRGDVGGGDQDGVRLRSGRPSRGSACCRVGSNFCGPWVVTVTPSLAASASMPHCMVM